MKNLKSYLSQEIKCVGRWPFWERMPHIYIYIYISRVRTRNGHTCAPEDGRFSSIMREWAYYSGSNRSSRRCPPLPQPVSSPGTTWRTGVMVGSHGRIFVYKSLSPTSWHSV